VIEQRDVTERELRAGNGIERHGETAKREIGSAHCTGRAGRDRLGWTDERRGMRLKRVGAMPGAGCGRFFAWMPAVVYVPA
jgi:hypothetical protein